MRKVGMIGKVEVFELEGLPDNEMYMVSQVKPNMRKDGKLPFVKIGLDPYATNMFYRKPKWWQWRKRRSYRKLLETK